MTSENTPQKADVKRKKLVLIIEDDVDLLKILTFAFEAEEFEVIGFVTGKEGLNYIMNEKNMHLVHLIVLDRLLPDMDGIEILNAVVKKFSKQIPVLILSLLSSEKDVLTGIKHGAVDYITKPFSLPVLMEKALILARRNNDELT